MLVCRIAANQWRLDRAMPVEAGVLRVRLQTCARQVAQRRAQAKLLGDPQPPGPDPAADALANGFIIDCEGANSLVKLSRYEAALERSVDRSLRQLATLQTARNATKNYKTNPTSGGTM